MNGSRSILFSAALLSLAAVSACSDATGTRRVPLSLSFATKSFAAKASVSSPVGFSADLIVGTGKDLVLISAQVVVDGIELSHDNGPNCEGTGEFQCENVEQAPQLVVLQLNANTPKTQLTVAVPEGSYERLDAHIRVPENGAVSGDAALMSFLAANPGKSVKVTGTYKGQTFEYTAPIDAQLELRFNPPFVVTSTAKNITVDVDVASWFTDSSGAALDPTASANAATIVANIRKSFNAIEDDNKDGEVDQ